MPGNVVIDIEVRQLFKSLDKEAGYQLLLKSSEAAEDTAIRSDEGLTFETSAPPFYLTVV